jgi:hypothetical protein
MQSAIEETPPKAAPFDVEQTRPKAAQYEGRIFFLLKTWMWYSAESSLCFRLGFGIGLNILCVLYLDLVYWAESS